MRDQSEPTITTDTTRVTEDNNERNPGRGGGEHVQHPIESNLIKPSKREPMQRKRESTKCRSLTMQKVKWGRDARVVES
jgi:hypothetical protein